ncbi:sulfurtransferase [Streptomyces corynorhini]|uniref:Sulfurtransferase n=1 Tax=Streptomyces corynorhini TaxID=2282652 RepID=A0A370BHC2_9ACTN|nr:rhodanese-like domain-containing protein [Streptomyces corynorhini]RDG38785.1 sulfurtransferase [Streptomyces corynorhini]
MTASDASDASGPATPGPAPSGPAASALVDAAWLHRHLDDVVLLDASVDRRTGPDGTTDYADGLALHTERRIPGARFADLTARFSDPLAPFPFTRPTAGRIAAHARELGIRRDSTVVVYDRLTGAWAARVWWLLRSAGITRVRVLNGGLRAWEESGLPVTDGREEPPVPGDVEAAPARDHFTGLARMRRIADGDDPTPAVCALRRTEYQGDPGRPRSGHIPRTTNLPYADLLGPHHTLDPAHTARLAAAHGLRRGAGTVLYCGGAINAAGLALALHEIGIDDVVLYDGSLSEWRAHPGLPLTTGDEAGG